MYPLYQADFFRKLTKTLSQTKRKRDALSKWTLFKEEIFHERKTYRKRFISIYDRRAVSRMRRRKYFSDFGGVLRTRAQPQQKAQLKQKLPIMKTAERRLLSV